jgi:hypothetical protein
MSNSEEQNQEEINGTEDEQATKVDERRFEEHIMDLKGEKRCAKSRMTRLLNTMASKISESCTEQG